MCVCVLFCTCVRIKYIYLYNFRRIADVSVYMCVGTMVIMITTRTGPSLCASERKSFYQEKVPLCTSCSVSNEKKKKTQCFVERAHKDERVFPTNSSGNESEIL